MSAQGNRVRLVALVLATALAGPVAAPAAAAPAAAAPARTARAAGASTAAPAGTAPGPPLLTPARVLNQALACTGDVAHADKTPVLLVHGTGSTPEENWHALYWLPPLGYPVCTVRLPDRATIDQQVSVEYVVNAIRRVAAIRHGRIDVIGHSQGGTLPIYALKFWPDLAAKVDDYVGLAPVASAPATGDVLCATGCSAPFQQLRSNAQWLKYFLLHPLPGGPSYTTIASLNDEIVFPQPQASHLDGASNVVIQDVCPNHDPDHFEMADDGAVWAVALDALTHPGPADPSRVPRTDCAWVYPPSADWATEPTFLARGSSNAAMASSQAPKLSNEPPLRCYMLPTCASAAARGYVLSALRFRGGRLILTFRAPGTVRITVRRPGRRRGGTWAIERLGPGTAVLAIGPRCRRSCLRLGPGRYSLSTATTTPYYTAPARELALSIVVGS